MKNEVTDENWSKKQLITQAERKKEQRKIAYHAHLLANISDAVIATDERFNITYWNPAAEEVFGWKADEVLNRPEHEVLRSEFTDTGRSRSVVQTLVQKGCFRGEMIQYNRDGKPIYVETTAAALRDGDGRITGYVSVNRDITDRKRMEETLKENEEKYRLYFENISDVIYFLDTDFRLMSVSPTVEKILGYKPEELIGKQIQDLNVLAPEYLQQAFSNGMRVISGESIPPTVYEFIARDGTKKLGEISGAPLIRDGKTIGIISVGRDITERRKMEDALQESERKYRRLFEWSNDIIVYVDKFGKVLAVNSRLKEMLGFMPEEVIGKYFFNLGIVGIKELPYIVKQFKTAVVKGLIKDNTGKSLNKLELNLRAKNGDLIFVEVSTTILKKDGKTEGFLSNIRDITERKQATEKLKASEKKYSTLVEKGNDGIVIIQDRLLKFISPVMAEISGFSINDVIGKPFIDFVSSPFRELVNDMYAKRLAGEEIPNKYEVELISKNGKIIPAEINASLIEYEGKPADMAIIRDITERKLTEKEIKKSLKEKEMLLSEIYHRVKNNMQIITSLLRLQSRHIKEEEYREMFKESQNRIISMSLVHEKLYRSKDLTQIDFNDYIRDLIKGLFQSYGANKGNIALSIHVKTISLGIDFAIPCGLIINELVTNSLKHAFPDCRKGEIRIILRSIDENMIELIVGDNGIGMPEDLDFKKTKTLGLHLVTMLAENQLHGDINLNRSKGTEFIIKFKEVK